MRRETVEGTPKAYPSVTICVPARNAAQTLERTLDSLLAQTYPNREILVCDNSSADDTLQRAEAYAVHGVRTHLNPDVGDLGENNWNCALSIARGEFVALYHADDVYLPTIVARQAAFLIDRPHVSAVFTMTQMIDEDDRPIRAGATRLPSVLGGQEEFTHAQLLNAVLAHGNFLTVPTMMVRREALKASGMFDLRCRTAADIDLYLRLARWGPVGVIDEPLHQYRLSTSQGSAQINKMRTRLADFFLAIDGHLADAAANYTVSAKSVALYQMERGADRVLCAMNSLAQGDVAEARLHLKDGLALGYFVTALRRPRRFARFMVGVGLRVSMCFGLGVVIGQLVYRAYQLELRRRRLPKGVAPDSWH